MSTPVELWAMTHKIGDAMYSNDISCAGREAAEAFAAHNGWEVLGNNLHTKVSVPVPQFMEFLESLVDGEFRWKPHAEEQIEAFIGCAWPNRTEQWDEE